MGFYEDKKLEQVEFDVMAESLDKKYLLVGECKWTTQENGKQLTAGLLRKANLLPFAPKYTIVPVLFLRNAPKDDAGNSILPEHVVELMSMNHTVFQRTAADGEIPDEPVKR